MAPSVVPNGVDISSLNLKDKREAVSALGGNKHNYVPGITPVNNRPEDDYPYDHFRPAFPEHSWGPLKHVPYEDKGLLGDPHYRNLLNAATDVFDYTPKIGTEISGIQLRNLTDAQKNDLARLIAHRGVVFFRGQSDWDVEDQLALGRYFGILHKHATTAMPKKEGLEEIHVVYTDEKGADQSAWFPVGYFWHSDVTYELQPPSYTSLKLLTGPPRGGGGDTLWSSGYAAYDALSLHMQKYLEGLTALHSAEEQAQGSIQSGRHVRREPVITEHPIIRINPVTGWKSLFINPGFVKSIVGIPKAESDAILKYLNTVIMGTPEIHVRFSWQKDSVAIWDNRVTNHSATYGFHPHRRHAIRVTPHGEVPYFDFKGKSQEEDLAEKYGYKPKNKDGSRFGNYND
ncbi:hypothetical protein BGX38DRAFT_1189770 [Terfezia claveryi]|nr:hypothetical protein BGX38DRAFT_1189770 [Terfezia claveryi]